MRRSPHRLAAPLIALSFVLGAGCSSSSEQAQPLPGDTVSPDLSVVATEMAYDPSSVAVAAGSVPVILDNAGTVVHDLRIEEVPSFLVEAQPGETQSATVTLEPGTYTFFCSIPGHRQAGMEGTLVVR